MPRSCRQSAACCPICCQEHASPLRATAGNPGPLAAMPPVVMMATWFTRQPAGAVPPSTDAAAGAGCQRSAGTREEAKGNGGTPREAWEAASPGPKKSGQFRPPKDAQLGTSEIGVGGAVVDRQQVARGVLCSFADGEGLAMLPRGLPASACADRRPPIVKSGLSMAGFFSNSGSLGFGSAPGTECGLDCGAMLFCLVGDLGSAFRLRSRTL